MWVILAFRKLGNSYAVDDNVEIRDATQIWGKDTRETERLIKRELGDEEKISVSFRERETQIRASVGMFNNQDDIDHFLQILSRLA